MEVNYASCLKRKQKTTYKGLLFDINSKELEVTNINEIRKCQYNEVVVEVAYAGICETDLHIIENNFPLHHEHLVLGHEVSGTVTNLGAEVNWLQIGDKVTVNPNRNCLHCIKCQHIDKIIQKNEPIEATVGLTRDGGWAQYCTVPEKQICLLPEDITLEQGVLCETLSCVSHAWENLFPLPHTARILVLGADLVGCLMTSLLHVQGYKQVTICEIFSGYMKNLEMLELNYDVISPAHIKNRKFDAIIDCTADAKFIEKAIDSLEYGGQLLIFRACDVQDTITISPFNIFIKEIKIKGSLINSLSFVKALNWASVLGSRYLNFEKLGVKKYVLDDFEAAFADFKAGNVSKSVFRLNIS